MEKIEWSGWLDLTKEAIGNIDACKPGVYQLRCLTQRGTPLQISRVRGIDGGGLIYIGRSLRSVRGRMRSLCRQLHGLSNSGHVMARHYLRHNYEKIFPLSRLQFRFILMDADQAKEAEGRLIIEYFHKHFDTPPLNFQLPNKDAVQRRRSSASR